MSFRHLLEAKDMQLVTPPQSVKTMSAILPAVHAPSTPGTHALFTGSDDPLVLSRIADDVAHHPGNVWLPIISLHREDAARLGYDDAERWCTFLSGYAMEMARAMKIPWEQFRWYAGVPRRGPPSPCAYGLLQCGRQVRLSHQRRDRPDQIRSGQTDLPTGAP